MAEDVELSERRFSEYVGLARVEEQEAEKRAAGEDRRGIAGRVLRRVRLEGEHVVDHPRPALFQDPLQRRRVGDLGLAVRLWVIIPAVQVGRQPGGRWVVEGDRDPRDERRVLPDERVAGGQVPAQGAVAVQLL